MGIEKETEGGLETEEGMEIQISRDIDKGPQKRQEEASLLSPKESAFGVLSL
jgi:hypothetical protein